MNRKGWSEQRKRMELDRYQYCPLCSQALTTFHDGERLRRRCENCGWVHYRNPTAGVAVILLHDDELLLGRRRSGGWCIPCGHVEWDETIKEAARREIHEETGLDVLSVFFQSPVVYASPGMSDESCVMLFCTCAGTLTTEHNEDTEDIKLLNLSVDDLESLVKGKSGLSHTVKFSIKFWLASMYLLSEWNTLEKKVWQ